MVEALGAGKRPPVIVTVGGYTYRTTVAPMGGSYWVPLAAEHREAAGVAGRARRSTSASSSTPRRGRSPLPDDLAAALDEPARAFFDALAYTHRKEWVRWVEEAKKPETRTARIEKTVESLRAGKKVR